MKQIVWVYLKVNSVRKYSFVFYRLLNLFQDNTTEVDMHF